MYLLFAGDSYYPLGGWNDYQGAFTTELDAITFVANLSCDWWQVVSADNLKVVKKGSRRYGEVRVEGEQ